MCNRRLYVNNNIRICIKCAELILCTSHIDNMRYCQHAVIYGIIISFVIFLF